MKTHGLEKSVFMGFAVMLFTACGGAGVKQGGESAGAVSSNVTGSIQSSTGATADFEGWVVALVSQSTGESRAAEIDAQGGYSFKQVLRNEGYTMVLLNSDYRLASVLSMVAADAPGKVYQWFEVTGSTLPRVIHKGPAMEFGSTDSVTILTDLADDSDSDGIPDGMESSTSSLTNSSTDRQPLVTPALMLADADEDGTENELDADIDGDGLPNWFDEDDDGNGTLDVFDLDANGDVVLDANQKVGDHYFGDEIEHIAVQIFAEPDSVIKAKISIKLSDEAVSPRLIAVMGAADLFDEALVVVKGETGGEDVGDIWDRSLKDDGTSFDDGAGDGVFSQKVKLKTGNAPSARQVLFVSVDYGTYSREFPFTFPDLTTGEFDFSYSTSSRRITKSGNPFGEDQEAYLWTVNVFDDEGGLVHSSAPQEGASNRYTIPEEDIDDDTITYTAKVFAQALEKVSGFPVYVVESQQEDLD